MKKICTLFLFLGILAYGNEITEPIENNTEKIKKINDDVNISCPSGTCVKNKEAIVFNKNVKLIGKVGIETIKENENKNAGKVFLHGDVDIDAPVVFKIGDYAKVVVAKSKSTEVGKVNIKGDILIGYKGEVRLDLLKKGSSYIGDIKAGNNSKININLKDSTMKSNIIQSGILPYPEINVNLKNSVYTGKFMSIRPDNTKENQGNANITLNNNSTLNLLEPDKRVNISKLIINDNSTVNLWDTKDTGCCTKCKCSICKKCIISLDNRKTLYIGELSGNSGTINMDVTKQEIIALTSTGNTLINIKQKTSNILKLRDYLLDPDQKEDKGKLMFATTPKNINFTSEETDEAGSIKNYKLVLENKPNGNYYCWYVKDVEDKDGSIVTDFKDDGATLYNLGLARLETDTLYQRMGELNLEGHKTGVWARATIGKNQECNKFYLIQAGIDRRIKPSLLLGLSLANKYNYTKYIHGKGYSNNLSILGYLTYLNKEKQMYLDLVAKHSMLKNKYDLTFATFNDGAKYSMTALGFGAEVGKKFKLRKDISLVPLIQGTYTNIGKKTYETDRGIKVNIDNVKSFIGKVGINLGYKTHYIKLGVLHEFLGDVKYNAVDKNNVTRKFEDKNKGTWFSLGVGGTFNINEKSYVYYDFEKTFSNCKYNKWQISLGYRYEI